VARELARVYRAARARRLPTDEAARLCFILSTLARILESSGFDERLTALEHRHAERAASRTTRAA